MARTPVTYRDTEKRDSNGILQVLDQGVRNLLQEIVRLLRVNNRHLEEMTGNTLNEEDLEGDQFSHE